jgi:hypothetical protein
MVLPTSDYEDGQLPDAGSALDPEACALEELRELWLRCTSPLLVTCGGRTSDLPFLRYRCLARDISLPALHLCTANRFGYFDRFDQNWHFDLADFLAGHGASQRLGLEELCALAGIAFADERNDLRNAAQDEASRIFCVFVRLLEAIGLREK